MSEDFGASWTFIAGVLGVLGALWVYGRYRQKKFDEKWDREHPGPRGSSPT